MLRWEFKKILKDKSSIVAIILIMLLLLIVSFVKPMLETQNKYWNEEKKEYVIDNRSEFEIANEKLTIKKEMIKSAIASPDSDKTLKDISKEKLNLDDGNKYENVDFYKVFTERVDFSVSIIIMMIIIVMIISTLYTDEIESNVSPIILSSKQRNKALYSKVIIAILLPIVLYSIYVGATWLITYIQYGEALNGGLQAYRITDMAILTKAMTIEQYALIKMITTTLMLLGVSVVSLLVSFLSNNSIKSISISAGFVAVGKILTQFTFLPQKMRSLLGIGNYIDVITRTSKISGIYNGQVYILSKTVDISNLIISIYGLIVIIGLIGCIYIIKKVLNK